MYLEIHIFMYIYICIYVYIYIYIYIYIRRPPPELERASLQPQPSNTIVQTAAPPSCRLHPTVLQTAGSSLLCTILKGCH